VHQFLSYEQLLAIAVFLASITILHSLIPRIKFELGTLEELAIVVFWIAALTGIGYAYGYIFGPTPAKVGTVFGFVLGSVFGIADCRGKRNKKNKTSGC